MDSIGRHKFTLYILMGVCADSGGTAVPIALYIECHPTGVDGEAQEALEWMFKVCRDKKIPAPTIFLFDKDVKAFTALARVHAHHLSLNLGQLDPFIAALRPHADQATPEQVSAFKRVHQCLPTHDATRPFDRTWMDDATLRSFKPPVLPETQEQLLA